MPETGDALYSRGKYRLEWDRRGDGELRSPFLQIIWYDPAARRNRSRSTGEAQIAAAEDALDRFYLERERGQAVCHACGRPLDGARGQLLTAAVADYLLTVADRPSIGAIRPRLGHILDFIEATQRGEMRCDEADQAFIDQFRKWAAKIPVIEGRHSRVRSPGTIEASVRQLAAVINLAHRNRATPFPAQFRPLAPRLVSHTPTFRADIATLAAMFRFAQARPDRQALLNFLRVSVATWARPDAAHDLSVDPAQGQWIAEARVVRLNPAGRTQTKKHRPAVPVPEAFAQLLDAHRQAGGKFMVKAKSIQTSFEAMQRALGLPADRAAGTKLIRRSIAQLARQRIGEANWQQGEIMLGHRQASTSDLYALFDPANLGMALAATEAIIDEIEALAPGAFTTPNTGNAPDLQIINGGLND